MAAIKRKKKEPAAASTASKKVKTSKAAVSEPNKEKRVKEEEAAEKATEKATEKPSKKSIIKSEKEKKGKEGKKGRESVKELVKHKEVEVVIERRPKDKKEKKSVLPKPLPEAKVAQKIVDEEVSESDDWSSEDEGEGEEFIGGDEEDAEGDVSMGDHNTNSVYRIFSTYQNTHHH